MVTPDFKGVPHNDGPEKFQPLHKRTQFSFMGCQVALFDLSEVSRPVTDGAWGGGWIVLVPLHQARAHPKPGSIRDQDKGMCWVTRPIWSTKDRCRDHS